MGHGGGMKKTVAAEAALAWRETWRKGMLMTAIAGVGLTTYFALTDSLVTALWSMIGILAAGVYVTFCLADERKTRAQQRHDAALRPPPKRQYASRSSRKPTRTQARRR